MNPSRFLVVRAEPNKDNTTWIATKMVGTLNVLNMICVLRSRWASGFRGASEHRVLFGATLAAECVEPDLLHVIPVRHDNMLDVILLRQDTACSEPRHRRNSLSACRPKCLASGDCWRWVRTPRKEQRHRNNQPCSCHLLSGHSFT